MIKNNQLITVFTFVLLFSCQKHTVTNCFPGVDRHYSNQEYKNLAETPLLERTKYFITESTKDGWNNSDCDINREGHIVFYKIDKDVYMSDVSGKCNQQTYGKIDQLITTTSKSEKFSTSTFRWKYLNTYDSKTGTAMVELHKYYDSGEIRFTMKILLPESKTINYKGFVSIY
ncbi:hypothetical protein [Elizabethkingia anophelis]|uniref:hypothetical protein n=1 Tax=Elizabethkingia anophelis TaxID=1117645 RepID=UPI00136F9300|nr:hypothetical protein [Elizabethkingia anophelis]MCT4142356.1 hypothetical protein [Elizabethkingia anophelis]MCT4277962.1 hypothetical protein [Elizabethkingia anophelis]MCT4281376.1 hypothetical protein [Elizabethkingia anophelis]MYY44172.1 hypothetical protein [Elizabethkingia anophelis]